MKMKTLERILRTLKDIKDFDNGALIIKIQDKSPVSVEVVKTVGKPEKVVVK